MASGSQITATDLSSLRDKMNTILNGTGVLGGYDQSHTVSANPATGDVVDDAYLDSVYSAAAKISNYYGISNPFTAVDAGTNVTWTHYGSHAAGFESDINTRFIAPWSYATGWDTSVAQETQESASDWNGSRVQVVKVDFADANTMNAWFAAGGELRVSASHSASGSEDQGTSWSDLAAEMGTYKISAKASENDVDTSTNKKHSDLTGSYVVLKKEFADNSDYSANYIQVEGYVDGSDVYVKTTLNDAHVARSGSGSGYGGGWSWTGADTVPGTSTVTIASKKLTNAAGSVTLTNPTSTVTDAL